MELIEELGGGEIGRVNLIATAVGGVEQEPEWFTYYSKSKNSPGKGAQMIVVMMIAEIRR
jgi:hypothetical protein